MSPRDGEGKQIRESKMAIFFKQMKDKL